MIIIETRSSRRRLQEEIQQTENTLRVTGKAITPPGVSSPASAPTVASPTKQVVQQESSVPETTEDIGYIFTVYPKTDKVFVKVRREELTENNEPIFFNHLDPFQPPVEEALIIPLEDFKPEEGTNLDELVKKKVIVTVTNKGVATKCRLAPVTEEDTLLDVTVKPQHLVDAYEHPEGVEKGLSNLGYSDEQLNDLMTLGIDTEDRPDKGEGVVRIAGEGYWDQVVEEDTERTIRVVNAIEAWKEKNLSPLKTKLCHNPIIAFSAR